MSISTDQRSWSDPWGGSVPMDLRPKVLSAMGERNVNEPWRIKVFLCLITHEHASHERDGLCGGLENVFHIILNKKSFTIADILKTSNEAIAK